MVLGPGVLRGGSAGKGGAFHAIVELSGAVAIGERIRGLDGRCAVDIQPTSTAPTDEVVCLQHYHKPADNNGCCSLTDAVSEWRRANSVFTFHFVHCCQSNACSQ